MAIADLKYVLKAFGGSDVGSEHEKELFEEALLMTLARAADADISIQGIEVDTIQAILKKHTGKDVDKKDIRTAARAELYARETLVRYLRKVEKRLSEAHCSEIVHALAEVFRSDATVSPREVDFCNYGGVACNGTPAQIAGLTAGDA